MITRTLKFIITAQKIKKDPSCDFSGLVSGTQGYLEAEFYTSTEWHDCHVAAVFVYLDKEYPVPVIRNKCLIPAEALLGSSFDVYLVGRKDDYLIRTDTTKVRQQRR